MTTPAPAVLANSIVKHLRSSRAGARPGDGTIRALLDGEVFINQVDQVFCTLAANGTMATSYFLNAAGMAAFLASLPTTTPTTPGVLYLNGGVPTLSQAT